MHGFESLIVVVVPNLAEFCNRRRLYFDLWMRNSAVNKKSWVLFTMSKTVEVHCPASCKRCRVSSFVSSVYKRLASTCDLMCVPHVRMSPAHCAGLRRDKLPVHLNEQKGSGKFMLVVWTLLQQSCWTSFCKLGRFEWTWRKSCVNSH